MKRAGRNRLRDLLDRASLTLLVVFCLLLVLGLFLNAEYQNGSQWTAQKNGRAVARGRALWLSHDSRGLAIEHGSYTVTNGWTGYFALPPTEAEFRLRWGWWGFEPVWFRAWVETGRTKWATSYPTQSFPGREWFVRVPYWPFAMVGLAGSLPGLLRRARRMRYARTGRCVECGYNRAGTAATAPCPECGLSALRAGA